MLRHERTASTGSLVSRNSVRSAPVSRHNSSTQLASLGLTTSRDGPQLTSNHPPLKILGLKFMNARLHFLLAFSRGLSVLPSFIGMWRCFYGAWELLDRQGSTIISVRSSELAMAGVWCIVSGYLSYAVLDGLMVRWIVTYSSPAAIVRMLSCATLNIAMIQTLHSLFSPDKTYLLHIWILASCIQTVAYIIQNFVTSNLALEKRARSVDLLNIAVFAVVPVGMASFITMLGLLRTLIILRMDLE
jgi:N-glycosylation protein